MKLRASTWYWPDRPVRRLMIGVTAVTVLAGATLGTGVTAAQAGGARAAVPLAAPAPVTPAGPITGTGCTTTGTATTCHVYAVAGSVTLPGSTAPVPAWKFQSSAAVPAAGQLTGSGPVLVVNSGNTVTLTLDNVNVGDKVSLAVPGLTGFVDDAAGVAAGGTKTYAFTAGRPGTYLYEAGHTENGARQALMGLAGALVVRPADWAAATPVVSDLGGTALPVSGFNDEAVLVLGDIDPAFAAAPLTYDLRTYNPLYRTINGKVYPGTDQIPSAKNNKVLLRYLNAGAGNHSMGVQGLPQKVVAQDSYAGSGMSLVADMLAPGQTEDVLVSLPSEGNFAVADTSGALDTAGLTDGTSQLAFGGMMTLLGTNVTPVTTDTVGPASAITAMTPNPAKVTTPVTLTTTFTDPTIDGGPSAVTAAEVLIDGEVTSLAPGAGLQFTPVATGAGTATGSVTLSSAVLGTLSQGKHRIYVRAQDSVGNWGPVTSALLNLAVTGATTSSLAVTPTPTNGTVPLTVTGTGDDSALGGTVDQARFTIDCNPSLVTTCAAPTAMTLGSPGAAISAETGTVALAAVQLLGEGTHTLYVQTHDSEGFWGPSAAVTFVVDRTAPSGAGFAVNPATNDGTKADPADPTSFKVSASFTDVSTGKPTSTVIAAEAIFPQQTGGVQVAPTTANDGHGFTMVASDGSFNSSTEAAYGLIPLSQLTAYPDGTYQIWMHAKDAAGNWGVWAPASFTMKRGGLFADGFEAGNLAAWTGGRVPATPGTRLVVNATAANASSFGLAASGAARASAYVITPAIAPSATQYHASFAVNPNSLGTYTQSGPATAPRYTAGQTGILTGMSGTTEAFQVQYRRVTPTGTAQVRLVQSVNGTATAWVNVGTTAWSTIQVDWAKGTAATLTFKVNGATSTLTNQNTSSRSISSARLGFLDSTQNLVGTAYFDSYVSSRTPLA